MLDKIVPTVIGSASHIAPRAIGNWAAKQVQLPRRKITGRSQLQKPDETWSLDQGFVRRWGSGAEPIALLIHGWEGHHTQLHTLGSALRNHGYSVVLVDPPAHGDASGDRASPQHFAEILKRAAKIVGPIKLLIGHSMGGLSATLAVSQGLEVSHLVTISAPADAASTINGVAGWLKLSQRAKQQMHHRIESFAGVPIAQVDTSATLAGYRGQLLVVHDEEDRHVPVRHATQIRNNCLGAQLFLTSGLGHARLLESSELCEKVLRFAESTEPAQIY